MSLTVIFYKSHRQEVPPAFADAAMMQLKIAELIRPIPGRYQLSSDPQSVFDCSINC